MSPTLQTVLVPINPAGWPFIAIAAAVTILLSWLWPPLGWLGAAFTAWTAYFFRDPDRVTPARPGLVVSPADGVVQPILKAPPPAELGMGSEPLTRISIFLNVFDVHVNRVPADGEVVATHYRPGAFVNAALDKASEDNERMAIALRRPDGIVIGFVQIAGWVARRIVCYVKPGQALVAGERFGHIRFGSRTDLYLPPGARLLVAPGQRMIGGETVIAELNAADASPRKAAEF